ncbi:hypothetical protein Tco_0450953 [Tanacetum coccineum]
MSSSLSHATVMYTSISNDDDLPSWGIPLMDAYESDPETPDVTPYLKQFVIFSILASTIVVLALFNTTKPYIKLRSLRSIHWDQQPWTDHTATDSVTPLVLQ